MQKLIALITAAVAFISGLKTSNSTLKAENDDLRKQLSGQADTIEALKKQHEDDEIDDEALEKAATEARAASDAAEAKAAELQAEIDSLTAEGEKLAAAITAEAETPNVDSSFQNVS